MRKLTNAVSALLCALLLLGLLAACGGSATNGPVADVAGAAAAAIGKTDSLMELDANFLGLTRLSADQLGEHTVLINAYGANIDEIGVFKAGIMSAKELKDAVDTYLSRRLDTWMEEYMPEEKPKLTNAEVKTSGDYVMYCILSDADKAAAFQAFESALK